MYTVYYIKSNATKALLYVGLTKDFPSRKCSHRNSLRRGKHSNEGLQSHVNFFGVEDLEFEIHAQYNLKVHGAFAELIAVRSDKPAFNIIWSGGPDLKALQESFKRPRKPLDNRRQKKYYE